VKNLIKSLKSLNLFIVIILGLLVFAVLYYFYHRQRSQAYVFVSVSLVRPVNMPLNIAYNSVPYYVAESISENDKEQNLLGSVGVEVLNKETYDWMNFGQVVNLNLKINAVKDRTGVYLYKNKPLLVGSMLDLKLTNSQVSAIVNEISTKPIISNYNNYKIVVSGKQVDSWIVDNLKIGDELKDNMGNTVVKIIGIRQSISSSPLLVNRGNFTLTTDSSRKDFEADIEIKCRMIKDICFFASTQKIKVNEIIYLPFKSVSLNFPITSIKPL
jgi:hypothetical protein